MILPRVVFQVFIVLPRVPAYTDPDAMCFVHRTNRAGCFEITHHHETHRSVKRKAEGCEGLSVPLGKTNHCSPFLAWNIRWCQGKINVKQQWKVELLPEIITNRFLSVVFFGKYSVLTC